jgi:large subunit ribosomal protein L31e
MSESEAKEEPVAETEEGEIQPSTEVATTEEEVTEPEQEEVEELAEETTPAAAEEEEEGEGEEEIEVVEERVYTIPLRHVWVATPRGKRSPRAARDVRDFIAHHMKAEEVSLSNEINSTIWARGINKPPRKVKVRAVKDKEGKVIVYPAKAA